MRNRNMINTFMYISARVTKLFKPKALLFLFFLCSFSVIFWAFNAYAHNSGHCDLIIEKSVDKTEVSDGEEITYNIEYKNEGEETCTGGGVRIEDTVPQGLNFLSETHSSEVSAGYGSEPIYNNSTRVVSWNAHEVEPSDFGEVTWTARVVKESCGEKTILNKARITSAENHGEWIYSNEVSTAVKGSCAVNYVCDASGILSHEDFLSAMTAGMISQTLTTSESDLKVKAVVKNETNCVLPVSLSTYKLFEPFDPERLPFQEFIDRNSKTIPGHSEEMIVTNLADCSTQYDLWYGIAPIHLENTIYGPWLLGYGFFQQNNICSNVITPPLTLTCSVLPAQANIFETVTWSSLHTGGEEPVSVSWSGDDGLSQNSQTVAKIYSTAGTKKGRVTATDNAGNSLTRECEMNVVDEEIVIPQCPFTAIQGRTIVNFPTNRKIVSNGTLSQAENGPIQGTLLSGKYKISLASFDGYIGRENKSQPYEQWFVLLKNNGTTVLQSNSIGDLEDNVRTASKQQTVNDELLINSPINGFLAMHSAYPDNSQTVANSLYPICAAFDLIPQPPPPPPPPSDNFDGSCEADHIHAEINQSVTWKANVSGGDGTYTYLWGGTDELSGNTANLSKTYSTVGTKNASVTITSGSKIIMRSCALEVSNPTPPPPPPPPSPPPPPPPSGCSGNCGGGGVNSPRVILIKGTVSSGVNVYVSQITSTTTGRVAGVFLSQLPYTGLLADYQSVLFFVIGVLFWSALVAYVIHKDWHKKILQLIRMLNETSNLNLNPAVGAVSGQVMNNGTKISAGFSLGNPYTFSGDSWAKDVKRDKEFREFEPVQIDPIYVSEDTQSEIITDVAYNEYLSNFETKHSSGSRLETTGELEKKSSQVKKTWMKDEPIRHTLATVLIREAQKEKVIISDEGFDLIMNAGDRQEEESFQILRQLIGVADKMYPRQSGWLTLGGKEIQKILFSTYMSMTSVFIDWLAKGEKGSAFAFVRTLKQQGHSTEAFLTEVVTLLDGLYRFRIEGEDINYNPHVAETLKEWNNEILQDVIGSLVIALDQGYESTDVSARLALVKIFSKEDGVNTAPSGGHKLLSYENGSNSSTRLHSEMSM